MLECMNLTEPKPCACLVNPRPKKLLIFELKLFIKFSFEFPA